MKKKVKRGLPVEIWVRREEEDGDSWLTADEEPDGAEGDVIGLYRLVEVGKVKLTSATVVERKLVYRGGVEFERVLNKDRWRWGGVQDWT